MMKGDSNGSASLIDDIPPEIAEKISTYLSGGREDFDEFQTPIIRSSFDDYINFIIFMYSLLIVCGVLTNLVLLFHVIYRKLYKDETHVFFINNALSDIVKCVCVIPISLYVLLVQNWMLGEVLCSVIPMIQDIPIYVSTLTMVLTAWDRYRMIRHPTRMRLPAFVCAVGTWLTSICMVLPYPFYIIYVDLGKYIPAMDGMGMCLVNLTDDMQEYMRGIFLVMYAAPMASAAYLFIKTSRELKTNNSVVMYEARSREMRCRTDSHSTTTDIRGSRDCDGISEYSRGSSFRARHMESVADGDMDIPKERRTQNYLMGIVAFYASFMAPLMIMRVVRLALLETYDNSGHFDIMYTLLVWFAFVPTCTTPVIYATWQLSSSTKERLRGYFRFSNRKFRRSCETVLTAGNATPLNRVQGATSEQDKSRCGQEFS